MITKLHFNHYSLIDHFLRW